MVDEKAARPQAESGSTPRDTAGARSGFGTKAFLNGKGSRLESIGVFLPETRVATRSMVTARGDHLGRYVESLTGIRERRVCGDGEDALHLAIMAARDCLDRSKYTAADLGLIVSCSISRAGSPQSFRIEPHMSHLIKSHLEADNAISFDVSNACLGMLSGLAIVASFIQRGIVRCGMVVSGERISGISDSACADIEDRDDLLLPSLTVGDAGSAIILDRSENSEDCIESYQFETAAAFSDLCIAGPRESGAGISMRTHSKELHSAAISRLVPTVQRTIDKAGVQMRDIRWFVPHQTSEWAVRVGTNFVAQAFGIEPPERIAISLDRYGNTASTTHFVALHDLLTDRKLSRGDRVMLIGPASGLGLGVVILNLGDIVERYGRDH
jgi:3-oxoacyl-[acyl-carrier-protein] synthase-3